MNAGLQPSRETWSGNIGFILATVGSAVGIGSIWKFPYEVGANGGGLFVFFYLLGLVLIVVPLMFAELAIGRHGSGDSVTSIQRVAQYNERGLGNRATWGWIGALGIVTGFLILSYYCVIGGWTLGYALETALNGLAGSSAQSVRWRYEQFLSSPLRLLIYDALFVALAVGVVARGVSHGIETASRILMPVLALLMLVLAGYAMVQGDVRSTLRFLFTLDWKHLSARTVLEALGLGFFSIGVGMGLMITYAAYAGREIKLRQVAVVSVIADTALSITAGFAVFPIVFAHGLDAAEGPGLVFVTVPLAFADMPLGNFAAVAFFLLLFVAALSSAIATFELSVAPFVHRYSWSRARVATGIGVACVIAGLPTILSFNSWAHWFPLSLWNGLAQATFYDLVDHLTSNILLPIGGLAMALFAGWIMSGKMLAEALGLARAEGVVLRFFLRFIVPAAIALVALMPLW